MIPRLLTFLTSAFLLYSILLGYRASEATDTARTKNEISFTAKIEQISSGKGASEETINSVYQEVLMRRANHIASYGDYGITHVNLLISQYNTARVGLTDDQLARYPKIEYIGD